jgi:MerR family copper efflux transcriptional regulator
MHMRTGELARNAGLNLQTIRFYERQGLLPKPERTASGYRSYQQSDLERVLFIRRNQELGFTLAEIKQLMDLHSVLAAMGPRHFRRRPNELQGIIEIGRERLLAIKAKAQLLNSMRRQLEWLLEQLESAKVVTCPAQSAVKLRSTNSQKSS